MTLSLRGTLDRYLPKWLRERPGAPGQPAATNAWRYFYSCALLGDLGLENAIQGAQARMPTLAPPSALPYLGRDRGIVRGYAEPNDVFALRMIPFRDAHKTRGNPYTLMRMVRAYVYPYLPKMRIVNNRGTWYTLNPDDTTEVVKSAGNWNWDGNTALRSRAWLIIYSDLGPWDDTGAWGDPGTYWGQPGTTWGTTATPEQVASVRAIVDYWRSATARFENIIIAFDPDSFDPSDPPGSPGLPDGTWGNWSKNVAGVQVPSRLGTARYWLGPR